MSPEYLSFEPESYATELTALISELRELAELDERSFNRILRRYPKDGTGLFSKSEIVRGYRHFKERQGWGEEEVGFLERVRMKPIRTSSGVAPVTVLSKPYPCPGTCIFCPSDVRMPKSYLSDEPGAQRADQHRFDPYEQTLSRLRTYRYNGHLTDKIELIVLGGTWSYYPEEYQVWFIKRCFDAMNEFEEREQAGLSADERDAPIRRKKKPSSDTEEPLLVDGREMSQTYNQVIREIERAGRVDWVEGEAAEWSDLEGAQRLNETSATRCVGLSLETRPDHLTDDEVVRLRRLGATKVQIGYQSLSDYVLALNKRGHDVAATRRAMKLLRAAGFKIHAHWMPNLYGSSPEADVEDFERVFDDADFRPDELKIYPCSLIESAELMSYYERGEWRPYTREELLFVLTEVMARTPEYCRLTRVIRDIPGTDIVEGNKLTNFRELAETELEEQGRESRDIRSREIGRRTLEPAEVELRETTYRTSVGMEHFLQVVTADDRLAGFLRLSLPERDVEVDEIRGSAMIREVHVYGVLAGLGESADGKSQHAGLGTRLIERGVEIARAGGFAHLAVISSVGTREYYRRLGFVDGELYQQRSTVETETQLAGP